jgi:hypothetical protein
VHEPTLVTLCYRKGYWAVDRIVDRESGARCAPRAFRDATAAICAGSAPRAGWRAFVMRRSGVRFPKAAQFKGLISLIRSNATCRLSPG